GGTDDNFTGTVFCNTATTSILDGFAPFTGQFRPEDFLWKVNNGQNGNGTWQLRILDDSFNSSFGSLISWSLVFSSTPARPVLGFGTNLPILSINTNGQTIHDDPKIICDMGLIDNGYGNRNFPTDSFNGYSGKIAIEVRGSSSQGFPKFSYGFETRSTLNTNLDTNVSLAGMPEENDWILSANFSDKSFCRNFLTFQLQREMGHWASRCRFVDVLLNGEYIGIYVLMEKIKRDGDRVDIEKLHPWENSYPDISGGYIIKIDKINGSGGAGWTSPYPPMHNPNGQTIYYQYEYPDPDSISLQQQQYIQSYVDSFESALAGPDYMDSVLGYSKFIGNKSFIDYFFSNEL